MQSIIENVHRFAPLYGAMIRGIPNESARSPEAVGKRLKMLRDALNLSQDRIAATLGMASGSASWSPYERGRDLLPIHVACLLCERYGVTLDWLYRGLFHTGMPFDLSERIRVEELRPKGRYRAGNT